MHSLIFAVALLAGAPVMAFETSTSDVIVSEFKSGAWVRDTDGHRIGKVSNINQDGSVKVIFESRIVTIPVEMLRVNDGKLITSLTKSELRNMR